MPYENGTVNEEEFLAQLTVVENILEQNLDCLVVCGGDFNVDFERDWVHTRLLTDFCDHNSLYPVAKHTCNNVDYTYNFNMLRFQAVDQFVISEQLFRDSVKKYDVLHDVCNISDHDPILLHLNVRVKKCVFMEKQFKPKPAWCRANSVQLAEYSEQLRIVS